MSKNIHGLIAAALLASLAHVSAQGTAFSYQGRLDDAGPPPNGVFDLTFSLYTATSGGSPTLPPLTNVSVAVNNGQFSTALDFGPGVFTGQTYWLELAVRTNGAGPFTALLPRQELFPAPYAMYAATAGNASTADNAAAAGSFSGALSGEVTGTQGATVVSSVGGQPAIAVANAITAVSGAASASTPNALVRRDANGSFAAGTVTATNFSGNAAGLTNLPAAALSGSIDNALLTNVVFVNAANNLTNVLIATNPANQFSGTLMGSLNGNATSATAATSATTAATAANFSGALAGDVTGTQGATAVSQVGGQTAAAVASGAVAANGATSANTPSALVARDANGSFASGTVTATNFTGNAVGLTNLPAAAITGSIDNALLTNVVFVNAANNLTNVLIANNPANQFSGTLTGSLNGNATSATAATSATTAATAANFSGALAGDVTGTQGATVVASVGGQTAAAVASATTAANSAASANTPSALVARDANGSFAAGTVTATNFTGNAVGLTNLPAAAITGSIDNALLTNVVFVNAANNLTNVLIANNPANQFSGTLTGSLNGNATSATDATSATTAATAANFSGALAGDVTGTQGATVVASVGGQTAAAVASGALAANGATSANTPSALVARDANGSFAAGTISATNFSGNAGGLTNLPAAAITGSIDNALLTNVVFVNAANILTNALIATNAANQFSGTFAGSFNGNASSATITPGFSGALVGDVTGTQGATAVSQVGGQTAAAVASGALAANGATSANTPSALVARDANGSFAAGTISATNFSGNAVGLTNLSAAAITGSIDNALLTNVVFVNAANNLTNVLIATNPANQFSGSLLGNAASATTTPSFSGALVGDVTGTQGATAVSQVGGQTAAAIASATTAANSAASANTPSALVLRDANGSFAAGTVTATNFTGNAIGLTNLPAAAITGSIDNALLTNVVFVNAANNLSNVLIATNPANQFSGNAANLTNYQGSNLVETAPLDLLTLSSSTNATIPFQQEGAIYQVVTTNLCFSNITGLGPGYNKMTLYLQATNNFTVSWLPHVNLVGCFTTNGLELTNSQGWWVMALTVLGTNWQTNTCTYAICPPNQ